MIDEKTVYNIVEKAKKYDELLHFQKESILCCTFCGKSQNEVKKLIAARDRQFICNECVELCVEIIEEDAQNDTENQQEENK